MVATLCNIYCNMGISNQSTLFLIKEAGSLLIQNDD